MDLIKVILTEPTMGVSHRKPAQTLSTSPPLSYDEVIFILTQSLVVTSHSGLIDYNITERHKYQTLDRNEIERLLTNPDFEEIITKNRPLAVFPAIGNFRTTVWGNSRRHTCYLFIDQRRLLWIADPSSQSIQIPRYSFQIDRVSSL